MSGSLRPAAAGLAFLLFAPFGPAANAQAPAAACDAPLGASVSGDLPLVPSETLPCGGIRPGARMDAPSSPCTFNFIFRDRGGHLYVGTAGHCVLFVGQRVSANGVGEFGTVVFRMAHGVGNDFAIVAIDRARYGDVSASTCHWGGPSGTDPEEAAVGAPLRQYGQGLGLGLFEETRARRAHLIVWEREYWRALGLVATGDSGSPVIFEDGRAAGILTHLSLSLTPQDHPESVASTLAGTRFSHAVAKAEEGTGLRLTLVTASVWTGDA